MLVVFPPIFVVDIKIIFDYNFIAPLMHPDYFFVGVIEKIIMSTSVLVLQPYE